MNGTLELTLAMTRAGERIREQEVSAAACIEDAYFRSVIAGTIANDGLMPEVTIDAREDGERGVSALAVGLAGVEEEFVYDPKDVYADAFVRAAAELVAEKEVERSSDLDWSIEARERPAAPRRRFSSQVTRAPFPLTPGTLEADERGSLSVHVAAEVLSKGRAEVIDDPSREVAGLLLGRIVHDATGGVAQVRVEHYVPLAAGERGSSRAHFAFDARTFAAARKAVCANRAADDGLVSVGWLHTHPPCGECFAKEDCAAQTVFFSQDDVRVQTAAFYDPYNVAIVAGKVADQPAAKPGFRIYCWYRGRVAEVAYAPVDGAPAAAALPTPL